MNFQWEKELGLFWISILGSKTGSHQPLFSHFLSHYFGETEYTHELCPLESSIELPNPITEKKLRRKSITASALRNEEPALPHIPIRSSKAVTSSITKSLRPSEDYGNRAPETEVLPSCPEPESSTFALSAISGPSIGSVKVFDVKCLPDTGQLVAATSGCEDGSDKNINIWDINSDTLLAQLDNGTVKPVVCLMFHPNFDELLLSADMACDVKLWNWKEKSVVRWWKRHHSRIIFQLGFLPGDNTRAVSCSGDQSLRIWNIHSDRKQGGSIHANEPISSFTFAGTETDEHQQKIIISLSSSIRIYRQRTLQLLHVINLKDMKLSSPITFIEIHPVFENFCLISSDHQLRLINMDKNTIVKVYTSNKIDFKLKGHFSPYGNYVYAATSDARFGATQKSNFPENTGCLIWKVSSGRLEQADIDAMQYNRDFVHREKPVEPTKTFSCTW